MSEEQKSKNEQAKPQFAPIVNRLGKEQKEFIRFKNKDGKRVKAKIGSYTEYEPEDTRLIKIAPMVFFSLDSHKVIMVPFTIKFTIEEYLKQLGAMSVNFENILKEIEEAQKEANENGKQ